MCAASLFPPFSISSRTQLCRVTGGKWGHSAAKKGLFLSARVRAHTFSSLIPNFYSSFLGSHKAWLFLGIPV